MTLKTAIRTTTLALLWPLASLANTTANTPATTATDAGMTEGEVRRIDVDKGKLTLRHGEIKHLDMPPMTMVFVVKDKALLNQLKPGDKLRFKASQEDGQLTVTEVEPLR